LIPLAEQRRPLLQPTVRFAGILVDGRVVHPSGTERRICSMQQTRDVAELAPIDLCYSPYLCGTFKLGDVSELGEGDGVGLGAFRLGDVSVLWEGVGEGLAAFKPPEFLPVIVVISVNDAFAGRAS
jgi:hypothetical protein